MIKIKASVFILFFTAGCGSSNTNPVFGAPADGSTGGFAGAAGWPGSAGAAGAGGEAGTSGSGGVAGSAAGGSAGVASCVPGAEVACACDSAAGTQVCKASGVFGVCQNNGMCCGATGGWHGCEGNGCSVCSDLVSGYPHYFENHPDCTPNPSCNPSYGVCSAACPAPTAADL